MWLSSSIGQWHRGKRWRGKCRQIERIACRWCSAAVAKWRNESMSQYVCKPSRPIVCWIKRSMVGQLHISGFVFFFAFFMFFCPSLGPTNMTPIFARNLVRHRLSTNKSTIARAIMTVHLTWPFENLYICALVVCGWFFFFSFSGTTWWANGTRSSAR